MIYLDTSVALSHLLGEQRAPPASLWDATLVSSRLIEYELWVRVHARGLAESHGDAVRSLLGTLDLLEMSPPVLARAVQRFPVPVRTLDAIHLASAAFLVANGQRVEIATYDDRMAAAATSLGLPLASV